jgi:hypothetical protein
MDYRLPIAPQACQCGFGMLTALCPIRIADRTYLPAEAGVNGRSEFKGS